MQNDDTSATLATLPSAADAAAGDPRGDRKQRQRIRWIGITLASYTLDTLFLALFAHAGTVPALVPLAYGSAALAICSLSLLFFSAGWNQRFSESGVSAFEIAVASLLQCAVVWLAPEIAFPYLANLFAVLAFGVLQLSLRQFALIWAIVTAATGIALLPNAARLGIPAATPFELTLAWLYFASILGRCAFLSVFAHGLRMRLGESKRKLQAALEQVRQLAIQDELTGLYNRRHIVARLRDECVRFERTRAPFSVALFDLDRFKSINDTHGHGAGDRVLKAFALAAGATIRTTDTFGRYGGEEFLLVLVETPLDPAIRAIERIRERMRETPWREIAPGLNVTVSVGVAESRPGEGVESLLSRADVALYAAKDSGRDRVVAHAQQAAG